MQLPDGLQLHCAACGVVIPTDAPVLEGGDCEFVARHKLAWYKPTETLAGQHAMAVAAWALIYDAALREGVPEAVAYRQHFQQQRRAAFAASAVRRAMTPEQVAAGRLHPRDRSLYAEPTPASGE